MLPLPTLPSAVAAQGPLPADTQAGLATAGQQLAELMPSNAVNRAGEQRRSASMTSSQAVLAVFLRQESKLLGTPRGGWPSPCTTLAFDERHRYLCTPGACSQLLLLLMMKPALPLATCSCQQARLPQGVGWHARSPQ
jgi:hypothetical protein